LLIEVKIMYFKRKMVHSLGYYYFGSILLKKFIQSNFPCHQIYTIEASIQMWNLSYLYLNFVYFYLFPQVSTLIVIRNETFNYNFHDFI
jgi:hypothetical protein